MNWASVVISVFIATFSLIALVFVSVLFSRTLSRVVAHADRSHDRVVRLHQDLLDRVMAGDFAIFKAHKMAEDAPDGEWQPPDYPFAEKRVESPSVTGRIP